MGQFAHILNQKPQADEKTKAKPVAVVGGKAKANPTPDSRMNMVGRSSKKKGGRFAWILEQKPKQEPIQNPEEYADWESGLNEYLGDQKPKQKPEFVRPPAPTVPDRDYADIEAVRREPMQFEPGSIGDMATPVDMQMQGQPMPATEDPSAYQPTPIRPSPAVPGQEQYYDWETNLGDVTGYEGPPEKKLDPQLLKNLDKYAQSDEGRRILGKPPTKMEGGEFTKLTQEYKYLQNLPSWKRTPLLFASRITNIFKLPEFLTRKGLNPVMVLADESENSKNFYRALDQIQHDLNKEHRINPERVAGVAGEFGRLALEFVALEVVLPGGGVAKEVVGKGKKAIALAKSALRTGGVMAGRELVQAPSEGETIEDRAKSTRNAAVMGMVLGPAGKVPAKVRIPGLTAGFGAGTYLQAKNAGMSTDDAVDAAIESMVMVLAFESVRVAPKVMKWAKIRYQQLRAGKNLTARDALNQTGSDMSNLRKEVDSLRAYKKKHGRFPDWAIKKYAVGEKKAEGTGKPLVTPPYTTTDKAPASMPGKEIVSKASRKLGPLQVAKKSPAQAEPQGKVATKPAKKTPVIDPKPEAKPGETAGKERTFIRITDKQGRGLMNNQAIDRSKLTDEEENELIELMDLGLEQPRDVPADAIFYFTKKGFSKNARLVELLKKASKGGFVESRITTNAKPIWETEDGQAAIIQAKGEKTDLSKSRPVAPAKEVNAKPGETAGKIQPKPSRVISDQEKAYFKEHGFADEEITKMEAPDVWLDENNQSPPTGKSVTVHAYHGSGRDKSVSVYGDGADGPALGVGEYSALDKAEAKKFGKTIKEQDVTLENPYVLTNDEQLAELMGGNVPYSNKERVPLLKNVRKKLEAKKHDGVIINVPKNSDMDTQGKNVKRLREIFGASQVVVFPTKKEGKALSGQGMAALGSTAGMGAKTSSEKVPGYKPGKELVNEEPLTAKPTNEALDALLEVVSPASRGPIAMEGATVLRRHIAELAHNDEVARETLEKARRSFVLMGREKVLDFIDRMETGKEQPTPELEAISQKVRKILDQRRDQVQGLGKGYLEHYYEHYFPHVWKKPNEMARIIGRILGKKPLSGPKSFMKKRSIVTIKEGMELGFEPVSDNPIDLVLLKVHEMDRFMMAQNIIADMKQRGMLTFVYARSKRVPDGHVRINDKAFTVYMPPEMTTKEAYDRVLMDNLMDILQRLGVKHERLMKLRQSGWWGVAYGTSKIKSKFAGPESVLMHELGHILGNRYGVFEWITQKNDRIDHVIKKGKNAGKTISKPNPDGKEHRKSIKKELQDLADARFGSDETKVSAYYKGYVRRAAEKEAVMLESLLHAPEVMQEKAPTVKKLFIKFLNDHAELRPILDLKPSLILGESEGKIEIPGVTELGKYYAPEQVATLLNNYLSPGLRDSHTRIVRGTYRTIRHVANELNQVSLALSLFHGLNTTTDIMNTHVGLGFRKLLSKGQRVSGLIELGTSPISPLVNLWEGDRLVKAYRKDLQEIEDPKLRAMIGAVILAGGRNRMDPFYYNRAAAGFVTTVQTLIRGRGMERILAVPQLPIKGFQVVLELLAKPVMEWLVPRQKLGAFKAMALHEMKRAETNGLSEEQLVEMLTRCWDSVDNRMGQLVYDNLFWNKVLKDAAMLSCRLGWNLGSWREYAGSGVDVMTTGRRMRRGDLWLSHKMSYVVGAIFVYSFLGAVLMRLMTGRDPEETKDYFFPKTGYKNPDGSDERLSLPTYAKDWYSYSDQPGRTLRNKLHPLWPMVAELINNENFYNTEIRHEDDPWIKQMLDTAKYIGDKFTPYSVRNYAKMRQARNTRLHSAVVSITGITSAPSYLTKTPAQKRMTEFIVERLPQGSRTKEEFAYSQARKSLIQKIRQKETITGEEVGKFTPTQLEKIIKEAKTTPFAASFKRLSAEEALEVYKIASPTEREQVTELLKDKLIRSEKRKGK